MCPNDFGGSRFIGVKAVRGAKFGLCLYDVDGLQQLALHYRNEVVE